MGDLDPAHPPGRPYGRRAFLGLVAGGLSSLWWGPAAWRAASAVLGPAAKALPDDVRAALPSPSQGWRIYTVNPPMPRFDPRTWRLTLEGLVERPTALSYADLQRLPQVEQTSDFHCVTGWSVPDVLWRGVRFRELVELAGASPEAGAVTFVSGEQPYTDSLTLEQLLADDAMLALQMDGRPLAREHGAPARVVMPRMYGYKGVKWVARMVFTAQAESGYWELRGYDADAWVGHSNGLA